MTGYRKGLHVCAECCGLLGTGKIYAVKFRPPLYAGRLSRSSPIRFFCTQECMDAWQVRVELEEEGSSGVGVVVDALEYVGPR